MSSSRRRTEHIERTRYPNPLPPPPYPPKFLSIPTPASRYADPRNLGMRLAQAHPVPMVVDAEAGMPLNMTDFPQAWYTDQELEAGDDVFPVLREDTEIDDEDAFLLSDMLNKLPSTSNGVSRVPGAKAGQDRASVTWLRRTEYLGAEQARRRIESIQAKSAAEVIDASREAQIARIKASFEAANKPLDEIKHPTKPGLTAVDSYSLFPDPDTWATRYDVFRFGDMPGRVTSGKPQRDPRIETAILRPHRDLLNEGIYSLFLVAGKHEDEVDEDGNPVPAKRRKVRTIEDEQRDEDEEGARLVASRLAGSARDAEIEDGEGAEFDIEESEDAPTRLRHVRDYLPHDETNRKDQELVFTFVEKGSDIASQEGAAEDQPDGILPPLATFERKFKKGSKGGQQAASGSQKAVYYHPVSSRAQLRVRRRKPLDPHPPEHWDAIQLRKRNLSKYEKIERLHERYPVDDFDEADIPERITLPAFEEEDEEPAAEERDAMVEDRLENGAAAPTGDMDEDDDDDMDVPAKISRKPVRPAEADDDDDEEDIPGRRVPAQRESKASPEATAEEGEDGEQQEQGGSDSGSESGSGSGSGDDEDEDLDDDELAALRAEAGDDAGPEEEEDEDTNGPRARRSRRAAAASAAAEEDEAFREQQRARNADLGGDDEDDEE